MNDATAPGRRAAGRASPADRLADGQHVCGRASGCSPGELDLDVGSAGFVPRTSIGVGKEDRVVDRHLAHRAQQRRGDRMHGAAAVERIHVGVARRGAAGPDPPAGGAVPEVARDQSWLDDQRRIVGERAADGRALDVGHDLAVGRPSRSSGCRSRRSGRRTGRVAAPRARIDEVVVLPAIGQQARVVDGVRAHGVLSYTLNMAAISNEEISAALSMAAAATATSVVGTARPGGTVGSRRARAPSPRRPRSRRRARAAARRRSRGTARRADQAST